jgi:hypothetical protein
MSERDERLAFQGPQGEQGSRGEKGERGSAGLSRPVRRAILFLFVLNLLFAFANFAWTAYSVNANNQARCATILAQVSIPVPRPVAGNPSREFEAQTEAIERRRARELGCQK